jgi:hypothetical protein
MLIYRSGIEHIHCLLQFCKNMQEMKDIIYAGNEELYKIELGRKIQFYVAQYSV